MQLAVLLVLGVCACLGSFGSTPEKASPSAITQMQVDDWTRVWQKTLDLGEWTVTTLIVRTSDLKPDTLGNLKWNTANRTAVVKVLNPLDYELPSSEIATDIEYTILHELIHLQLSALPHDGSSKLIEE